MPILNNIKINDAKKYESNLNKLKESLKILDKHLNGKKYLIGENLSLADLQIGTSLTIGF